MQSFNEEQTAHMGPGARPPPTSAEASSDARFTDWVALAAMRSETEGAASPRFPEVGERFADCALLAELGRGAEGRVFLASQADLGDRLIVLKVTRSRGREHLALARLVHTHIAPLLFARDLPEVGLRLLAMPFVGGTSLLEVRDRLHERSAPFTGRNVVELLARSGPKRPTPGGSRHLLEQLRTRDAPTFVAWLGACLADALGHAHDRGLMHLDVKPGNVLLAADGTPLLLDFHLAQKQIAVGDVPPESFGGTEAYMPPEQKAAGLAFRGRERSPVAVDGRADLYALGVMLFEMLAGNRPDDSARYDRLRRAGASAGLSAIIAKCLDIDPTRRYPSAAMLADDLRRHLANRPLRGVPNRSLSERWRKWQRRNPGQMARLGTSALIVIVFALGLGAVGWSILEKRQTVAEVISESRRLREQGNYTAAVHLLEMTPRPGEWTGDASSFDAELAIARSENREDQTNRRRADLANDLIRLATDLRWSWDLGRLNPAQRGSLKHRCVRIWDRREELQVPTLEFKERERLIEVIVALSALEGAERRLDEAQASLGVEPAIAAERSRFRCWLAPSFRPVATANPRENYWAGRALLRVGLHAEASLRFAAAEAVQPDAVWPCFYHGVCAFRLGNYQAAERAFRVCEALLPNAAEVCVDRASALMALGRMTEAKASLDRAITLRPTLGQAWYQRGVLSARQGQRREAIADLEQALTTDAPTGPTHFNLAVLYHENANLPKARNHLRRALDAMPDDAEALRLLQKLDR